MSFLKRIAVDFVAGLLVGLMAGLGTKDIPLSFSLGIVSALMTHIIMYIEIDHKQEKKTLLQEISKKLDRTIEHAAFFTDDQIMEKAIALLRSTRGGKTWIIAKFISRQLTNSFSMFKIVIDGDDYSEFAEHLYPECEDSIFLTCPFTPQEWFEQLILSNDRLLAIAGGGQLEEKEIPPHVRALLVSSARTKRRLVILSQEKLAECAGKKQYLGEFLRVNKGVETRFVDKENLVNRGCPYDENCDYTALDGELLLVWERPSSPRESKPLILKTEISEDYKKLLQFFDWELYPGMYVSGEDLLRQKE